MAQDPTSKTKEQLQRLGELLQNYQFQAAEDPDGKYSTLRDVLVYEYPRRSQELLDDKALDDSEDQREIWLLSKGPEIAATLDTLQREGALSDRGKITTLINARSLMRLYQERYRYDVEFTKRDLEEGTPAPPQETQERHENAVKLLSDHKDLEGLLTNVIETLGIKSPPPARADRSI